MEKVLFSRPISSFMLKDYISENTETEIPPVVQRENHITRANCGLKVRTGNGLCEQVDGSLWQLLGKVGLWCLLMCYTWKRWKAASAQRIKLFRGKSEESQTREEGLQHL